MTESPRGIFLELRGVSKTYQRGQEAIEALRECSATFAPGQMTLVLGPSGGGKSTLLQLLGGMDRPTQGQILAEDMDVTALSAARLAQWRRRTIGFVFQNFYLLPGSTAEDNVALPLLLDGQSRRAQSRRARELLDGLGLGPRARHTPAQLSGGQIQRVAIARALAHDAPVILADEPTGNLDSESGMQIMRQLQALAHEDGRTVIVVSHNPEYAVLADRVLRIRDGRIVEDSRPISEPTQKSDPHKSSPVRGPRMSTLVAESLKSLSRRRTRGILTSLGVMVGVASMVLLISIGAGLQSKVVNALSANASLTMMTVSPSARTSSLGLGSALTTGPQHPITNATLQSFSQLPHVRAAYGSSEFLLTAQSGSRYTTMVATSLPPSGIANLPHPHLLAGHMPTRQSAGILLPRKTALSLFGLHGPHGLALAVGRHLRIKLGEVLGVTGISSSASAKGAISVVVRGVVSTSLGASGYVNSHLASQWLSSLAGPHQPIQYASAMVVATGINQVSSVASRIRHRGYGVTTTGSVIHQINHEFGIFETGLGIVGGIALAVAGLMIAVVMSMAVLERRREIGIWRALGARRRDIFILFLAEAIIVGLIGGILGVAVGWGLGQLGSQIFHQPGLFLVPLWLVLVGLVFGGGVAAVAGAIPANHAARLKPVEALRGE